MKQTKILYWTTTFIIFLFEGVVPALTSQTELAREGIRYLGYPAYFGSLLIIFKILGVLALVIPQVPKQAKEWAYAGFTFNFIAASVSHAVIDGANFQTFFPLIFLVLLAISYITYHRRISTVESKRIQHQLHKQPAIA